MGENLPIRLAQLPSAWKQLLIYLRLSRLKAKE